MIRISISGPKRILLCSFLLFSSLYASAQDKETQGNAIGIQLRPIVPSDLFSNKRLDFQEGRVAFSIVPQPSFSLGTVLRLGLYKQFSFETGIHYTKRSYKLNINDSGFTTGGKFRFVDYEIPLLGLIYIRIAEKAYMNTAFGLSLDFFPNDIRTGNEYYDQIALRKNWVLPALMADVGVEYRTEKNGFFYFGGSYHRMLVDLGATKIDYARDAVSEEVITGLTGHYFALDFKYFFPNTRTAPPDYY